MRRVKCDEGKPHCNRCLRFGAICDGYAGDRPPPTSRAILPKQESISPASAGGPSPPYYQAPSGPSFKDELEKRFFQIYYQEWITLIRSPSGCELLEMLIPTSGDMEPYLRHGIDAITAISKINNDAERQPQPYGTGAHRQSQEYTNALKQYDKALSGMRNAIQQSPHDIKKALLACLLVHMFETLEGNESSGIVHARSGLLLFDQWVEEQLQMGNDFVSDETLLSAYSGLDLLVLIYLDNMSDSTHRCHIQRLQSKFIDRMPETIKTIEEAKLYSGYLTKRNYHFIITANEAANARRRSQASLASQQSSRRSSAAASLNASPTETFQARQLHPSSSAASSSSINMQGNASIEPFDQRDEYIRYQNDIQRWHRATSGLFAWIKSNLPLPDQMRALALKVHTCENRIMLAGTFISDPAGYDALGPEFADIVSISQDIVEFRENGEAWPGASFELGIANSLFLVASRCRDQEIKGKAIELLRSATVQEEFGIRGPSAEVAGWIRELDQEGSLLQGASDDVFTGMGQRFEVGEGSNVDPQLMQGEGFWNLP